MPWHVIVFPSLSVVVCCGVLLFVFFYSSRLNDVEMGLSTVPVKRQLPFLWHPSVNAIRTNICSWKLLPDLCCFFQCLPGSSSPSPVIPADPQKVKVFIHTALQPFHVACCNSKSVTVMLYFSQEKENLSSVKVYSFVRQT